MFQSDRTLKEIYCQEEEDHNIDSSSHKDMPPSADKPRLLSGAPGDERPQERAKGD